MIAKDGKPSRSAYTCPREVERNGEPGICGSVEFSSNGFQTFCDRCGGAVPRGVVL